MGLSCIVPGCKTNRKGGTKTKLFFVPRNLELRQKWEAAINIPQLIPMKHHVCQKHFREEEILMYTEHRDIHGNFFARVPLKQSRLAKNAVPCIDLNQSSSENQNKNSQFTNSENSNIILQDISNEQVNSSQLSLEKSNTTSDNKQVPDTETIKKECNVDLKSIKESNHKLFTSLTRKICDLNLPNGCHVNVSCHKNSIIIYELYSDTCSQSVNFNECSIKRSIVVKKDLEVIYSAYNKIISAQVIQLIDVLQSFKQLQSIINSFFHMTFCSGIIDINLCDLVKHSVIGYTKYIITLRHKKCHLLCTNSSKCLQCQKVKKIII